MKLSLKFISLILVLVLIVAWLKPSYSRFKDFASDLNETKQQRVVTKRLNDYFLWAYFEKDIYLWDESYETYRLKRMEIYRGCLLNFRLTYEKNSN